MNTVHAIVAGAAVALSLNILGWFWKHHKGQKGKKYISLEKELHFSGSPLSPEESKKLSDDILNKDWPEGIPLEKLRSLWKVSPETPLGIKWNDGTEGSFSESVWRPLDPLAMDTSTSSEAANDSIRS